MKRTWRFWLWTLVGCVNLCVGLFAYLARDNLFHFLIKPSIPFQVAEPPPAPNYSDSAAWAKRPQDAQTLPDASKPDVFFIHATTAFSGASGWNGTLQDPQSQRRLDQIAIPNHAAAFEQTGRLWVPQYRQGVLFSMLSAREDTRGALDLAYEDIRAAFENFSQARLPGQPYILVGHEQGALHALRLLKTEAGARKDLIAVYLLELGIPPSPDLPPLCQASDQTDCMVTYKILDAGDERGSTLLRTRTMTWTPEAGYHILPDITPGCVNPLTGSETKPNAPASANRGSASATGLESGLSPALLPGETGARCVNGGLYVEVNRPAALSSPRFSLGARYKLTNFNLFYEALGQDSARRTKAWTTSRNAP
jgi:Protein of unknown function (DUF3089)